MPMVSVTMNNTPGARTGGALNHRNRESESRFQRWWR